MDPRRSVGLDFVTPGNNIPVSPPSYEEAVQLPTPDLTSVGNGDCDEPPPSYSEATLEEGSASTFTDMPPEATDDRARLIVVNILRRSICHRLPRRQQAPPGVAQTVANRRKWHTCTVLSVLAFWILAGAIFVFVMHTSSSPSPKPPTEFKINIPNTDLKIPDMNFKIPTIPTVNPELFKWLRTPDPRDADPVQPVGPDWPSDSRIHSFADWYKKTHFNKPPNNLPGMSNPDKDYHPLK